MRKGRKLLAILLSIAMVMCSTLTSFADGSVNENNETTTTIETTTESTTITEPTTIILNGVGKSTPSIVDEEGNDSGEAGEEGEASTAYEEEPEEDETTTTEAATDESTTESSEDSEGESSETSTTESESTNESESTTESESVTESSSEETSETTIESTETSTSESSSNVVEEETIATESEIVIEEVVATTSMIEEGELFGTGEWCWWVVDETDPDNITIHYSNVEPADYSSYASGKKGKTSSTSTTGTAPGPTSTTVKQSIKTAVFDTTISAVTANNWFYGFTSLTTITNLSNLDLSNVVSMFNMFKGCTSLTSLDYPAVTASQASDVRNMFDGCTSLTNANISQITFGSVQKVDYMFRGCTQLASVNVSGLFSTSTININSSYMFQNCTALSTVDFSGIDMSNVSDMSYMFDGCTNLTSIDFSNTSVAAVTKLSYMFRNCTSLTSLNVSSFNTANVTSKSDALKNCDALRTLNLSASFASIVNSMSLKGNWKKSTSDTIYEDKSNKTTIPAEAGEYLRAFKITFDCKGGNAIAPIYKAYNESLTLPNAVRAGFTFNAWYNESEFTNVVASPITVTSDRTIYAKWSGGEGATLVYWRIGKKYSSGRSLQISMRELPLNSSSYEFAGSFSNTADFNNETEVPWHPYRSEINSISNYYSTPYFKCKSMAYWFKDMTKLTSSNLYSFTNHNDILESIAHAYDGCTNIRLTQLFCVSNAFKNMDSAFKNCSKIKSVMGQKLYGVPNNSLNIELENGGFRDAFAGCSELRRVSLRHFDFSNYTGDVFSFANFTKLVKVRVKNSGNLFNRVNLVGEWWEYESGQKYTSANMPTNVSQIRKYETFSNTIYWYIQGNEVHLSSSRPSNSNYKDGHYFNGDECNVYGMLPLTNPDNAIIVLDNNIVIRNNAGDDFFANICYTTVSISNISNLNTSEATSMVGMFDSMTELTSLDLGSFNTSSVTDMNMMFYSCEKLTSLDLSSFNTSKVTDMSDMFGYCTALQSVRLNSFNTSKVETMWGMFEECAALTSIDLSSFSTSRLDYESDYNEDGIWLMFSGCRALRTIYVSEAFSITYDDEYTTISGSGIFDNCENIIGGNGTTYNSSKIYGEYARIDRAGTPGYFTLGGAGYIAPTNGGGDTDDGGSGDSGTDSGDGGSSSGSSSSGSSGGSGGGIAAIDNQINNAMSQYVPVTTQVAMVKSITGSNALNGDTSSWSIDPISGKWKLSAVNANGQAVNASNGFYQVNKTVTKNVNGNQVNEIASSTYFFDANGNMVTGWVQTSDNKWYFFDNAKTANEGAMVTGWRVVQGQWYYFGTDGTMYQNTMTPDGYMIDANGHFVSEVIV